MESGRRKVSAERNILVTTLSQSRKESILICLLTGNRGFIYKMISRNLLTSLRRNRR